MFMQAGCMDGKSSSQSVFSPYSRDDFTIVPLNIDTAFFFFPFQTVFPVAALSAFVFLQMGHLGVIFLSLL